jgi:Arc/MetJ family transcription regulator
MRANIDIDDKLLADATDLFGLDTKTATVEEAWRRALLQDRQRRATKEMIGIGWDGDLDAMREGRDFEPLKRSLSTVPFGSRSFVARRVLVGENLIT